MTKPPAVCISEQEKFMSKLRAVVDLTASSVGDDYFKQLSLELSIAFDVEYVAISESIENFKHIRTIAYCCNNKITSNIEYDSENTPCGTLQKNEITFYPTNLKRLFPLDLYLEDIKADSYLGMPFFDTDGTALGHVCLLGTKPMDKNIYDEYLLKIITARVSAEFIRSKAEAKLIHLATHDPLTNIPNKMLFWDRLNTAIARSERNQDKFGLLFIDLNNFKHLNDSYGHDTGDKFLIAISNQLKLSCRESDTLCRYGGDEFVIIIEGLSNHNDITKMTNTLHQKVVNKDYVINDFHIHADLSIGAAIYPEHGTNSEELLEHADKAMYIAKKSHIPYRVYSDTLLSKH
jgi:diguanylate cyclase (GGDEF)-like protein